MLLLFVLLCCGGLILFLLQQFIDTAMQNVNAMLISYDLVHILNHAFGYFRRSFECNLVSHIGDLSISDLNKELICRSFNILNLYFCLGAFSDDKIGAMSFKTEHVRCVEPSSQPCLEWLID